MRRADNWRVTSKIAPMSFVACNAHRSCRSPNLPTRLMTSEVSQATITPGSRSAGKMLKEAREAKGMHLTVVATNLRVPVERVQALEEDRYNDLPDLVFARALAMSLCRQIKIDPTPILAHMPDRDPSRSVRVTAAISAPLGGVVDPASKPHKVWIALGFMLILALIGFGLNLHTSGDSRPNTSVEAPGLPPNFEPSPNANVAAPNDPANPDPSAPSNDAPAGTVGAPVGSSSAQPKGLSPSPTATQP